MTMFGGNPGVSHWAVSPVQKHGGFKDLAERKAERERMAGVYKTLKERGIKQTTYFQFKDADKAGKASQRKAADKEASRLSRLTGIAFDVAEGCFL